MNDTMHEVYLHGGLGEKYTTDPITVFARDLPDVINGLACRFGKGFKTEILSGSWHIGIGKPEVEGKPSESDRLLTDDTTDSDIADEEVHIYPRVEGEIAIIGGIGAGLSSVGGAISGLGAALIAPGGIGGAITGGTGIGATLINTGLILAATTALSAVVQAISTSPKMDYDNAEVDRNASLLYNGVVNIVEQGGAVPLLYGKHMIGSTVISAAMVSDELGLSDNDLTPTDSNFALPVSTNWSGVGATLTTQYKRLDITKTANAGEFGGAVLTLQLEEATKYKVSAKTLLEYDFEANGYHYYDDVVIDALDGATELGKAQLLPALGYIQAQVEGYPTFTFTTLQSQVNPTLRIYPAISSAAGTLRKIEILKIERVHV